MTNPETKFDKFQFDTDFFEVLSPAEVAAAEEADQAKEHAYAEGFAAGQKKQQDEMQTQLTQQLTMLQRMSDEIKHQQDVYLTALARQALQITTQTLHHVLDDAAAHYPQEILEKHLRDVILQAPLAMPLTLKINPEATTFHEKLGSPGATIQGRTFTIEPDPQIALGDCVVVWHNGGVEASLAEAKASLEKLLNSTPPDPTIPPEEPTATPAEPAAPPMPSDDGQVPADPSPDEEEQN